MESEIQKRIERKGIVISRVPDWAKEIFKARSKEEFCDDYGMCLASMVKECGEYNQLKQMFFENGLNLQMLFNNSPKDSEDKEKSLNFGNGKKIKLGGKKK